MTNDTTTSELLKKLIRAHVLKLKPYSTARDEFSGAAHIYLDANENSWGAPREAGLTLGANRYPDPLHKDLRAALSAHYQVTPEQIFVGSGSDEAIDLLVRLTCEPGRDKILICPPTYGMYEVAAHSHGIDVITVPLTNEYHLDLTAIKEALTSQARLTFLCSPNNPTGNLLSRQAIEQVAEAAQGFVVIDEAYVDFSSPRGCLDLLARFPHVVILRTFSKAWGLAGIRCGMAFAHPTVVEYLNRIKSPYNVNLLTTRVALEALKLHEKVALTIKQSCVERDRLMSELKKLPCVETVYPSDANFILAKFKNADAVFKKLLDHGVVTRSRTTVPGCSGSLRITVGRQEQNDELLAILSGAPVVRGGVRVASESRVTNETEVFVALNLDGAGIPRVTTDFGFFNHMLELFAAHSGFDLTVQVRGDTHVDEHHSIEDVGIALGTTFARALGDKRGIARYGFVLPMDESKAEVAVDLSGRSAFVWQVKLAREKIGDVATELFPHFFKSFAEAAKLSLHITAQGENEHHIIEAIFKGVARALKNAAHKEIGNTTLPSTKGLL